MRGVVFSDLVASLGAHRGTLHDVIKAPSDCLLLHAIAAVTLWLAVFLSARIFDK
jgi:hypothetical protein